MYEHKSEEWLCALITQRTEMKLLPAKFNLSLGICSFSFALSFLLRFLYSLFFSCKCFYFWLENITCGSSHIQFFSLFFHSFWCFAVHSFRLMYNVVCVAALKAHITKNAFVPIHKQNGLFSIFNMIIHIIIHSRSTTVCEQRVQMCRYHIEHHSNSTHRERGWIGSDQKSRTSEMWRQQQQRHYSSSYSERMNEWNAMTTLNKKQ